MKDSAPSILALLMLPGRAYATSGDGAVVVGEGVSGSGTDAFVWTEANGMQRLFDVLVATGTPGLTGWHLLIATGISVDGQWVAGIGSNPLGETEAFLANIAPVPIPSGVWLLATGLAGLGGLGRWRQKAKIV